MRVAVLYFIVLVCFGWVIYNLIKINILKVEVFKNKLDYYTTYQVYTNPARGNIFDRNGYKIAYNEQIFRLVVHKSKYNTLDNDQKDFVKNFIKINFSIDLEKLIEEIYLDKVVIKENPDYLEMCKVMENLMSIYGLDIDIDYKRKYSSSAFAFVCGFVNVPYREDIQRDEVLQYYTEIGKSGLELQYDSLLRGKLGKTKYFIDPQGHPVKIVDEYPPKNGTDLKTTINGKLQEFSYYKLKDLCDSLSMKNGQPVAGSVILMRINGEILVLACYPSFYPDSLKPDYNKIIQGYPSFSVFYNRAINGMYPAASTFKIVTSIAALEEGLITPDTHIYCGGVFMLGSHPFYCFNTAGHGSLPLDLALAHSCDVFYYTLGYKLRIEKIKKYSEILGLNKKTGIDLPFESSGFIPDRKWKEKYLSEPWTSGDDVNISIGQGLGLVTPLQMAVLVASVATGYKPVPFLNIEKNPILVKIPIKEKNLRAVRKGMEEAVNIGTASVIRSIVKKYKVAGKTGTAEVTPNDVNPKGLNNTWFVGYFGLKEPEFVIVVSLEASGGYGGNFASTLAAEIIRYIEINRL